MEYRNLSESEIHQLKDQGCLAEDWNKICVHKDFVPDHIRDVQFSGEVYLGKYVSHIDIGDDISKPAGIRHAYIKDCIIGDNVSISDVNYLVNYHIENNVVIDNVDRLIVSGETSFGNGIEINVLNENGGRKVPMFDTLTAQIAYLLTTYRHDKKFIRELNAIIKQYVDGKKSKIGKIKQYACIIDCGIIKNVTIGEYTKISGANYLEEGSLLSQQSAPIYIGSGVIAKGFIVSSGSTVTDSSLLEKSFIGQSVQVGRQFSAENSLIFCNSECFHSEVCSIFAGPYTVTHHKSTLLIAGMFSFFNAGSGSNQSNHMYKLGPVHQGILERGSKTGSFAYLMWPGHIGAFSVVIGKHHSSFDTSDLPFSYIIESDNKTILIPALNFFTVGTKRDSIKWPDRDQRNEFEKLDIINYKLLTPYIIAKVIRGIDLLKNLYKEISDQEKYIHHNGIFIERSRLEKAISDYQTIIDIYLGNEIISRLDLIENSKPDTERLIISESRPTSDQIQDKWIDLAGMIAPGPSIDKMCSEISSGKLNSIEEIHLRISQIHSDFESLSWRWCQELIAFNHKIDAEKLTFEIFSNIINSWKEAYTKTNNRILDDAAKEFTPKSRIGYGVDGNDETSKSDFGNVVGEFEKNTFVVDLKAETDNISIEADTAKSLLASILTKE